MMKLKKKKLLYQTNGIKILNQDKLNKLKNTPISPSVLQKIIDSPAEYIFAKFYEKEVLLSEPIYFAVGKLFHRIMEEYFRNGCNLSGTDQMKIFVRILKKLQEDKDKTMQFINKENQVYVKTWLQRALQGFIELDKKINFTNYTIASIPTEKGTTIGIEVKFKEQFREGLRPLSGMADLILISDNGLWIIDWKTGSRHKEINQTYKTQQYFYAYIFETMGLKVDKISLIYPFGFGKYTDAKLEPSEEIFLQDQKELELVEKKIIEANNVLNKCIETGFFPWGNGGDYADWKPYFTGKKARKNFALSVNEDKINELVEFANGVK